MYEKTEQTWAGTIKGKGWSAEFTISKSTGYTHVQCAVTGHTHNTVSTALADLHNMFSGGQHLCAARDYEVNRFNDFEAKPTAYQGYTRFSFVGDYRKPASTERLPISPKVGITGLGEEITG